MNTILLRVRKALRRETDAFDDEIIGYIKSCLIDLKIAGVNEYTIDDVNDEAIITAIIIYCKLRSGFYNDVAEADRLKASYDEMKAQLSMHTGYTDWLK